MPNKDNKIITGAIGLVLILIFALLLNTRQQKSSEDPDDIQKRLAAAVEVEQIATAVANFANEHKKLPMALEDLVPIYLPAVPKDPYNKPYKLISNGPKGMFVLYLGKDGISKGYVERDMDIASYVALSSTGFAIQK